MPRERTEPRGIPRGGEGSPIHTETNSLNVNDASVANLAATCVSQNFKSAGAKGSKQDESSYKIARPDAVIGASNRRALTC